MLDSDLDLLFNCWRFDFASFISHNISIDLSLLQLLSDTSEISDVSDNNCNSDRSIDILCDIKDAKSKRQQLKSKSKSESNIQHWDMSKPIIGFSQTNVDDMINNLKLNKMNKLDILFNFNFIKPRIKEEISNINNMVIII